MPPRQQRRGLGSTPHKSLGVGSVRFVEHSLTLLNDPTFVEAARVFAQRMLREGGDTVDGRLDFAFRLAVSRDPDDFERQILKELLEMNQKVYKADPEAAKGIIAVGLAPADKALDAVTLASWTAVARAILNFNETITRN